MRPLTFDKIKKIEDYSLNAWVSLDCCNAVDPVPPINVGRKNGEETMITATTTVAEAFQSERRALRSEAYNVFRKKDKELLIAFGLKYDKAPKNIAEALQRIKDGKFEEIKKGDDDYDRWDSWYHQIRWRDPAVTRDQDGYDAASAKLTDAYNKLELIIAVKEPNEAFDAVAEFETATFH